MHYDPEGMRTMVIKLPADVQGDAPTSMRVLGSASDHAFGHAAGSAGEFDSRMFHESLESISMHTRCKLVFFWDEV